MRTPRAILAAALAFTLLGSVPSEAEAAATGIVINEIESDGDAVGDWVELYNPTTQAIDISGVVIRDNDDTHTLTVPTGTTVAAGGYYAIYTDTDPDVGFGLGKNDSVRLYDADATTLLDEHTWTGHASTSYGRCPDGVGEFATTAQPTRGAANACQLPGKVVINEIESQAGSPDDWIELYNAGGSTVDLAGYVLSDNSDDHRLTLPAGTSIAPGAFLTVDVATVDGGFGLGGADSARLFAADGTTLLDSHSWTQHSATSLARCPDGTGALRDSETPTKNAANKCAPLAVPKVAINEVNSDSAPADFIELFNYGTEAADLSGFLIKDNDDARTDTIKAGTVLQPGGYLLLKADIDFSFGLGKADSARLFLPDGTLVDSFDYQAHGVPSWGRCPNGTGEWTQPAALSPGYGNCGEEPPTPEPGNDPWPGAQGTTTVDTAAMFLEDSSGLDFTVEDGNPVLWAVDNGTGTFWKLNVTADGGATFADGWAAGKRARFAKDADDPAAKGPDAEGITVAGDGFIYLASERDNSDKGVNFNSVLKIDPNRPGPDVVASQEWDLTASLPQVSANTGIEAVEWVSDADLVGKLWDDSRDKAYDPADYPLHGDGLFFVAVEDNGGVYGYALNSDGTLAQISLVIPGLGGVMALDYDTTLGVMWAMCDDGCSGTGAQITLNGTPEPAVRLIERPTGLPDTNNEGFATSTLCDAGERDAWWFTDGVRPGALHRGTLGCPSDPGPTEPPTPRPSPSGSPRPVPSVSAGPGTPRPGLPHTGV